MGLAGPSEVLFFCYSFPPVWDGFMSLTNGGRMHTL
jgi:hypothetical protein